jgi:hypothetical protein
VRGPFTPSLSAGPYRLPRDVRDRLALVLVHKSVKLLRCLGIYGTCVLAKPLI